MADTTNHSTDDCRKRTRTKRAGKRAGNAVVYDVFLWVFNIVVDLFFREIHPRSTWRIPKTGPIIFVAAPHANQFIDPLILMRTVRQDAKRRISILTAEKSMRRAFIGRAASLVGAVPVGRALDSKKPVPGKIYLADAENDPTLIRGSGVDFTDGKIFEKGGTLVLPSVSNAAASAEIQEILGPTELRVKKPFKGDVATKQLTGQDIGEGNGHLPKGSESEKSGEDFEGTSYEVAPHIDQGKVYEAVFTAIHNGDCIGIFPEGGSHDRTELLPLKAGLAIMALGALAKEPDCGVTIVPVGMNYFHAHKFRSRAVVEFGSPITIDPELVKQYSSGDRRGATSKVLEMVYDRLTAVTTLAPDYDTLMMIQAVRRLYNPKGKRLPLPSVVELNRRLIKGYTTYKDDPRIVSLRKQVLDYNRTLFRIGVRDHQLSYAKLSWWKVIGTLIYRVSKLVVLSVVVLPGTILFAPVFIAGKTISTIKAKEALAASTVKVRARDVMATWKILVSLALAPTLDIFYAIVATIWTHTNRIGGRVPDWVPLWLMFATVTISFPFICFGALRFGEIGMDIFKSLRPLMLSISPTSKNTLVKLRERRESLQNQINDIINELGPELFPDFDKRRIISEDEAEPVERPRTPPEGRHRSESGAEEIDVAHLTASPPASSSVRRIRTDLPHNDSFHNLNSIGIFASRPGSPDHTRSRTNSSDGIQFGKKGFGFSPIDSSKKSGGGAGRTTAEPDVGKADMDSVSRTLHQQMRERGRRRTGTGSGSSEWEVQDAETTGESEGGTEILTPGSEMSGEMGKKDI
ncbi:Glycerol-3-phosphate/dihydroxyacetone phosphate acyltransferase [Recurvomyces mirabilis]|nr:Glycerol-3-phosphate/dihydroxyacetone phosphate acyltransferase [Recurvomyces mirabilis]